MKRFKPEIVHINCPLCSSSGEFWKEIKGWKIDKCNNCSFIFCNPIPTEETIIKAYSLPEKEYQEFFQSEYIDTNTIMQYETQWQNQNAKKYLNSIHKYRKDSAKLLEIGCSSGAFLELAQENGWDTIGVDPGKWGQKEKDKKLGIQRCSLFKSKIDDLSVDVVFIASVVEHLSDPVKYFKKIHSLMKKNGKIYIVGLPNMNCHATLLRIDKWIGNHPPIHLGFYKPKTINYLLNITGFDNIQIKTYGISETILEFIFNRNSGKYSGSYTNVLYESSPKGKLLMLMRNLLNVFFNITGTGSVIEVLAEKK